MFQHLLSPSLLSKQSFKYGFQGPGPWWGRGAKPPPSLLQFRYDGSTESSTSSRPGQESSPRSSEKSFSLSSEPNHLDVFSVTGYSTAPPDSAITWAAQARSSVCISQNASP